LIPSSADDQTVKIHPSSASSLTARLDCSDLISAAPIFQDSLIVAPTVLFDESDPLFRPIGLESSESVKRTELFPRSNGVGQTIEIHLFNRSGVTAPLDS
jgi:hypothetical protein